MNTAVAESATKTSSMSGTVMTPTTYGLGASAGYQPAPSIQLQTHETDEVEAESNMSVAAGEEPHTESQGPTPQHPNALKMTVAYQLIINNPEFYEKDKKVQRFLDACKLTDPTIKQWRASMTNARKELNDKAIRSAQASGSSVVVPTEQEITDLACTKFRESWKKMGNGQPLPTLPLLA